ncbi:Uncharacterized membrane protein YuiD, partial [Linum perenne]
GGENISILASSVVQIRYEGARSPKSSHWNYPKHEEALLFFLSKAQLPLSFFCFSNSVPHSSHGGVFVSVSPSIFRCISNNRRTPEGICEVGISGYMADSADSGSSSSSSSSSSFITNYPLISALVAFAIAQSTKFFTSWYREKRWDVKQLIGSGGMPSSHSSTVTALAMAIGFQEGFEGSLFAAALILASIVWLSSSFLQTMILFFLSVRLNEVMYDATGVRLQAGRQAELLNQIVYELPAEHPLAESKPLRELLGHTPAQVHLPYAALYAYVVMLDLRMCDSLSEFFEINLESTI